VSRDLKPYPVYAEIVDDWLGKLPSHWGARRLRTLAELRVSNVDKNRFDSEVPIRLCNYIDVYKNPMITAAIPFMHATATYDEIEHFRLKLDDVIITKDSETWNDIGVPSLVRYSAPDLVCGYHLALLRPRSNVMAGRYLFRALQRPGCSRTTPCFSQRGNPIRTLKWGY
jgi:type I restriction enzyme S subunit